MQLALRYDVKLDKSNTTGELVRRVFTALDKNGVEAPIGFWFEDGRDKSVSMCARAIKAQPALAPFTCDAGPAPVLTNLAAPWAREGSSDLEERLLRGPASGRPIARDVLVEIADGVPKRFALHHSHFFFGPLGPLMLSPWVPPTGMSVFSPGGDPYPFIIVESSWWTPRRELSLTATAIVDAPPRDAKKLPPLPPATASLLAALGAAKITQKILPTADERESLRASQEAADALAEAFKAALDPTSLPHALGRPSGYSEQHGSLKEPLAARLKPLGYKHQGARVKGILNFTRRTSADNVVVIEVDRTPIGAELRLNLALVGPLWAARAHWLPVSSVPQHNEVHTEMECNAAADNIAFIVRRWEAEVAVIDALMGPGARWFEPTP